jgi:hypothetical protein
MKRFWYSFYADDMRSISGNPPRTFFCSGYDGQGQKPIMIVCAEAESAEVVAEMVKDARFYPEARERFCEEVSNDWKPSNRFPDAHLWQIATPEQQGPKLN